MKKNLLCFFGMLLSGLAVSQSIPNGGLENWTSYNFENPDVFFNTSNYQSNNNSSVPLGINVAKVTDAYHGNYAIKLTTSGSGTNIAFAYYSNGDPGKTPAQGGTPYAQKPTGVRFYYKSNVLPNDTALFLAVFKKAGASIGAYIFKFTGNHSTYTLFNPTLSPALPAIPDSVVIAATSSNAFANTGSAGSTFQMDSVSFTGPSVAYQPANFNGDFETWLPVQSSTLNNWNLRGINQRVTDIYSGNYAIELQTGFPPFGGGSGIQSAEASTGYHLQSGGTGGGSPYTNQIDTLVFYYKYIPADPGDNGEFYIYFKKNGVQFMQTMNSLTISPSYHKVMVPFNLATAPDSINIMFRASHYPLLGTYNGSDLKVDNIYLTSQKIPISQYSMQPVGCVGQPIQLYDNSGNMPNAWGWILPGGSPGSSTAENPTVVYNSPGTKTISMIASNQFGSGALLSKTITINSLPNVSSTSTVTACGGSNVILTASGANTYTWSSGQTTSTIMVTATVSSNYIVTGTANGCTNTAVGSVVVPSAITPQICMVTTDSLGQNNEIYWDKTLYTKVDSFIIYRETPTFTNTLYGSYSRIGAVSKNAFSMFTDTTRSVGGFVNGDPNFTSYKYKLQILDSCGQYGALSPYHQSIFVQDQQNGNFNWNPYTIEGSATSPVSNYILTRRNVTTGATSTVAATTSNLLSDPYYNVFYSTNIKWYVEAQGFNCNPTFRTDNILLTKVRTKSNQANERGFPTVGIKTNAISSNDISVYPNPTNGILNIECKALKGNDYLMDIKNVLGQSVIIKTIPLNASGVQTIDMTDFNKGIYFLNIRQNATIVMVKKIVVE